MTSQEPQEEPSIIDVTTVTVAPILVVLVAGYVIGILVLVIERYVQRDTLNNWARQSVRRWQQNKY